MANDRPDCNNSNWTNPWGPMSTPMQQWMMAVRAWTEAWTAMMPPGWPPQRGNMSSAGFGASAFAPPSNAAYYAPPAVAVRVSSHRVAEVTTSVNLIPGADTSMLTVGWLKGEGANPPLRDVSIACGQGTLRIGVPVPADQPHGTYCGDIKAPDGRIAGTLSVVIGDLSGKPA